MKPGFYRWLLLIAMYAAPCVAAPGVELTLGELEARGDLRASLQIETPGPYYQRAPLILAIDIATTQAFRRGTRVPGLRIPGALLRPVSSFALNSSERRDGRDWVSQRWRYRVYPRQAGPLPIPPVRVQLFLKDSGGQAIDGELELRHPELVIEAPPGVEELDDWVATPLLEVTEDWDSQGDTLLPGDALTRRRRFTISDAPGMLVTPSEVPIVAGLSFYDAPARVEDRSNRGRLSGIREEKLVVTLEQAGDYLLPGRRIYWFNTRSGTVEEIELPPYEFTVLDRQPPQSTAAAPESRLDSALLPILFGFSALVLVWTFRRLPAALLDRISSALEPGRRRSAYRRALRGGDARAALQELEEQRRCRSQFKTLTQAVDGDENAATALRALLFLAYGDHGAASDTDELPDPDGAEALWRALSRPGATEGRPKADPALLNPRSPGEKHAAPGKGRSQGQMA